jgi:NAD+ kinase
LPGRASRPFEARKETLSSSSTSPTPEAREPRTIARAAVVTHGRPGRVGDALERVRKVAAETDVELVADASAEVDVVLALGGDGTMLRALHATLGTGVPVFGINFGRVGFLTSAEGSALEPATRRLFQGEIRIEKLCTLVAEIEGKARSAVNDVVVTSARPGRMVELGWEIGGERLGSQPCDGLICATPSGSTAYNLSNGGPVMMWGLDAMAITFVAPHSLDARPIVVPRGLRLKVTNDTAEGGLSVLVDGQKLGDLGSAGSAEVAIGPDPALLALLPEASFFSRYHQVFG